MAFIEFLVQHGRLVRSALLSTLFLSAAYPISAAEHTLVVEVDMTCPVSEPPLILMALKRAPGVISVVTPDEDGTFEVVFEDGVTAAEDVVGLLLDLGFEAAGRVIPAAP